MPNNPYANDRNSAEIAEQEFAYQDRHSFAVPEGGAPYSSTGYAPSLRISPTGIPGENRLYPDARHDFRPDPENPPEDWYGKLDADKAHRHSVEQQDADGWEETKSGFGLPLASQGVHRFAENPRAVPPPEDRLTMKLSPRTYNFLRPFQTGLPKMGKRDLNGWHFSMADHKRDGQILGMAPQRMPGIGTRNTYRITPGPWDQGLVDKPPENMDSPVYESVPTVDVPSNSNRSLRLT